MILTLSIINAFLIAAVIYLYIRQVRFERACNQFVNSLSKRLPEMLSPVPMLQGVAFAILVVTILRKLFSNSEDENPTA